MKTKNKIKEFVCHLIVPIHILILMILIFMIAHSTILMENDLVFMEALREDNYPIILNYLGLDFFITVSLLLFIIFLEINHISLSHLNFVKNYIKSEKTFEETFLENKDEMIRLFKNKENFLSCVESVKKMMESEKMAEAEIAEKKAIEAKKLEDKFLGKGE